MGIYEFSPDDAFRFAREFGFATRVRGRELIFNRCPFCHAESKDKNTFAINLDTGQYNCKRASCGATGNMITLSRQFDFSLGKDVDEYYKPKDRYRHFKMDHKVISKEPAVKYLEGRGIPEEITKQYQITVQKDHDNILVFPFFDDGGNLSFIKYRKTDFDKSKGGNKEWCEKNGRPILFGMDQCSGFGRLVVTEGQIDSLSVTASGISNAVSVPMGKNGFTWIPYCWNWITKFQEIIVFGDYENGNITLLDELRRSFKSRVKHVREEDYQGCKDANELLRTHGKEAVRRAVEQAIAPPINRIIRLADVKPVDIYSMEKLKTGISALDKMLYGGIPFGGVCVISGKRGEGKSTFGSQLIAEAVNQGYVTLAYSGEMPNSVYQSWFEFQIAGPQKIIETDTQFGELKRFVTNSDTDLIRDWYYDKAFIFDSKVINDSDDEEKTSLLELTEQAVIQYGARVVLIDNLMSAMFDDPIDGDNKYDQQGRFVNKLASIARDYNCLVLLIAHTRKNVSGDVNDDITGSGDITNLASVTLDYSRDKNLDKDQRKLIIAKNRLFGITDFDGIVLNFDDKSKRIYGPHDDVYRTFGWANEFDGFVPVDPDEDIPFD